MLINFIKAIAKRKKRAMEENDITILELNDLIAKGALLIDVRSPQEYKEGHLKNAISLPEYELLTNIEKVIPNKIQKIIVYCSTGSRSKKAEKKLKKMGYINVYNLYNGLEGY